MMLVKNIIKSVFVLSIIFSCFACQKEDLSSKPDKIIENTTGTVIYNSILEMWGIGHYIPGVDTPSEINTITEVYHIIEMPDKNFPLEEGKQVLVSGFCYHIPDHILADKGIDHLERLKWYYIKVTDVKYDYRGFLIDQLRSVPRIDIPIENLPEWLVAWIDYLEEDRRHWPDFFPFAQIAKGEWNEQTVYLIRHTWSSWHYGTIRNEAGDDLPLLSPIEDLLTSKNWVVIYEFGDVPYPIFIID